jgi:hypothetical protein
MRYYRHHRLYLLDLDDSTPINEQLFNNQRINRKEGTMREREMERGLGSGLGNILAGIQVK